MERQTECVSALNDILRGEISAVETYRQALDKIQDLGHREALERCEHTHEKHVAVLRDRIANLGGAPATGGGAWGAYAKLIQGGAKLFGGDRAAISALEEGEDHVLKTVREHLGELDLESRRLIEEELLPEQEDTHAVMSTLKHFLH